MQTHRKKIIIIGAGPGGLTAGMILAYRGFEVVIYEKDGQVGGRNQPIIEQGYKFDTGPTFLMMKYLLDEVFEEAGAQSDDYLKFTRLDPMYRLQFKDFKIDLSSDHEKMRNAIKNNFPGNEAGYDKLMKNESRRYRLMFPCLQKHYGKFSRFFDKEFLRAAPYLSLGKSMYQILEKYYDDETLRIAFTFQSKYLGMSPWDCPGAYMMIPYIEHNDGIYHTEGGLSEISAAMAEVAEKNGASIKLNSPVKELIIEKGEAKGVILEGGRQDLAHDVLINADFSYAMTKLAKNKVNKYTQKKLERKQYSCSTYMLYLGLDKIYDLPHHNIIFSDDYRGYINDIFKAKRVNPDLSFYIRNASLIDKTLAPEGHSAVYILVPVPNNRGQIDWQSEAPKIKQKVYEAIKNKTSMKDIEEHVKFEKEITPAGWENDYNVYIGATFNLAHNLGQMLYFRPHNKFESLKNCYLAGGGTHPGSGLPTIYESGRISANLISRKYNIKFITKNLQAEI